jgi:hypothetical protein
MINERDYIAKIGELLRKYPDFPDMEKLNAGYTTINAIVVDQALKGALENLGPGTARDDKDEITQTPFYRQLGRDKSGLYNGRARLSNSFHQCKTDEDRARVSDQIQDVQVRIEALQQFMRDVRYQKITVALAEQMYTSGTPQDEPQKPPSLDQYRALSDIDLMKRQNSVRVRISQVKRKLEDLSKLPDSHKDRNLIPQYEKTLREYKLQREYVTRTLSERKNAGPSLHTG